MAYKKRQPKIMSDGNIAHVGMIVVLIRPCNPCGYTTEHITRIKKLYSNHNNHIELEYPNLYCNREYNYGWTCQGSNIRKATLEEKKQYWAELAQK